MPDFTVGLFAFAWRVGEKAGQNAEGWGIPPWAQVALEAVGHQPLTP